MFDYELFRVNLIMTRKALSYTQEDLANAADISEKNLSKIESGSQIPNLSTIISILNVFNSSVDSFMNNMQRKDSQAIINKIDAYLSTLSNDEKDFVLKFAECLKESHTVWI